MAGAKTAGIAAQLQRRQHRLQISAQAAQRRGDDKARQGFGGFGEQAAGRVVAARGCGRQRGGGIECFGHAQRELRLGLAAVVGQHRIGNVGRLAVAGVVGGHGQKLVALAGLAGEQRTAGATADLLFPDLEVSAVFGHVDGHMLDTRGVVAGSPAHLVAGSALGIVAVGGGGDGGGRRLAIQRVADGGRDDGRRGIKEHPGGCRNHGAGGGQIAGAHGVRHKAAGGLAIGIGRQQATLRVVQHLAGVRVDGLQQPGGQAGFGVDAGRHAQHIALALGTGEVKVALEHRLAVGHMDVDVANFQVAQAQAAHIQVGIDGADQADFSHRRRRRVVKAQRVGQRIVARHVG